MFAVRIFWAHGKEVLCRAFLHWRTAKKNVCRAFLHWRTANTVNFFPTAGRYHLVLPLKLDFFFVTFAVRQDKAHGKHICLPCVFRRRTAKYF
jgi:hypothetical protein